MTRIQPLLLTLALLSMGCRTAKLTDTGTTLTGTTLTGSTGDGGDTTTTDGGTSDGGTSDGGTSTTSDGGATTDGGSTTTTDGGSTTDGGTTAGVDADGDGYLSIDSGGDDCDDANAKTHPDAAERCDEVDNNCNGVVDEDVQTTWYADSDGDGEGDASSSVDACDPALGYVSTDTDCDDSDATISTHGTELCDGVDNNCDGAIDEDDAIDASSWHSDGDGDGYGSSATAATACDAPTGMVSSGSDCDDTDADVHPGADEICNDLDDDCDGLVDDDDPGLTDASTWAIDYDGDGYGSDSYTVDACSQPTGWVDDATDCDDTEADSFPGNTEICDGLDNDCNGDIDEDTATDAATWYADSDSDGYGDADVSSLSCEAPDGTVSDSTDCDDSESTVWPGANELYDGLDNDCDGEIDEGLWIGTGADGALEVADNTDLAQDASGGRTQPDAAFYAVSSISGATLGLTEDASGLAAGDEVLIIDLQGSDDYPDRAGTWELGSVASVSGAELTLALDIAGIYGPADNTDLTDQIIVVQRVPHYTNVTVAAAAILTTTAWDDGGTGVLAFRATGQVTVEDTGSITVAGRGFAGGGTGTCNNCDAFQGESTTGVGVGDEYGSPYNEAIYGYLANAGGGGANITGAGGSYGAAGEDADAWYPGTYTAPSAGDVYGDADLVALFLGSGGGGVWNGGTDATGEDPGPGGSGGGVLYIGADTIMTVGGGALDASGGSTSYWAYGSWTYGAGGGSGGSLWLTADLLDLAADSVLATGGAGMQTDVERLGGNGGAGRVRIDANEVGGYSAGSTDAATVLETTCDPDPESVGAAG